MECSLVKFALKGSGNEATKGSKRLRRRGSGGISSSGYHRVDIVCGAAINTDTVKFSDVVEGEMLLQLLVPRLCSVGIPFEPAETQQMPGTGLEGRNDAVRGLDLLLTSTRILDHVVIRLPAGKIASAMAVTGPSIRSNSRCWFNPSIALAAI